MNDYSQRKYVIIGILLIIFLSIIIKLFVLQVLNVDLKLSSENNSQRKVVQYPSRGLIYDRNDKLLVCNQVAYDLMIIPRLVNNFDTLSLTTDLGITKKEFIEKYNKTKNYSIHRPSVFYSQMNKEQFAKFQEHLYKYEGFYVQNRYLRDYKVDGSALIFGNVGEVSRNMLDNDPYYKIGDIAGKSGIEYYYEKDLRGEKGSKIYLVDVHNKIQGSYMNGTYDSLSIPGSNIRLTLDSELQTYGEQLMQNKIGSIVAIEPKTGEILSIVSSPGFDPALLVGRGRGFYYDSLLNSENKPLYNRAVSAVYPPGSIYKTLMSVIGLHLGVINENSSFECNKSVVGCHNHPPNIDVAHALGYSCNPYFYAVVKRIIQQGKYNSIFKDSNYGLDTLRKCILEFGLEQRFPIGLTGVSSGSIPSVELYDKLYGKYRWAFSTIASISIGQGEVLVSPLQMANIGVVIANKGYYFTPHLVKEIKNRKIDSIYTIKHQTSVASKHFDVATEGMYRAVNTDRGTARGASIENVVVCGKTGTAQNPHGEDHSVFMAFAPRENPQIAIAVYIENAGFGGTWAAPIASLMIEKYLNDTISNKWKEQRILDKSFFDDKE